MNKIKKVTCDYCRKCGETICGNDTENLRCFEPRTITEEVTKDILINKLIDDDIDTIINQYSIPYLSDLLRNGFCGYNKYSMKELKQEVKERELI